ncbi:MAG: hypothetical protein Q7S69_01735 [Nitrosomonadaceae bacterium]|nr:hypothetical protein [Nitrosomonadaceae bacterium]
MKREVEREREIPAFSISIGELEVLWDRLTVLFENPEKIYGLINIRLPAETLEFKNIEELKQYSAIKGGITNFSLTLISGVSSRRISIRSERFFKSRAIVQTTADNEAWCAGAIETVYSFLQSHKMWYHWFVSAPTGLILVFLSIFPFIAWELSPEKFPVERITYVGWLLAVIAIGILHVYKENLFPAAVLRITEDKNFIRKYSGELSLALAVLSVVLTLLGWYLGM